MFLQIELVLQLYMQQHKKIDNTLVAKAPKWRHVHAQHINVCTDIWISSRPGFFLQECIFCWLKLQPLRCMRPLGGSHWYLWSYRKYKVDINGDVEFNNVYFRYLTLLNEQIYLMGSISIPAGKTWAFVGQSRSRKSSVTSSLEKYCDLQVGKLLIDDIKLKEFRNKWSGGNLVLSAKNLGSLCQPSKIILHT